MTFNYDEIIKDLRAAGKEADAQAIEELLGRLYEAEEVVAGYEYKGADHGSPEARQRHRLAAQAYYDRRLIKR